MKIAQRFPLIKNWIASYRVNRLATNTAWMLLGQGLCLLMQAMYFVIIARSLGVQQYGAFVAAAAFTQILSPFVGFGGGNLLVKNVAQDNRLFSVYWGNQDGRGNRNRRIRPDQDSDHQGEAETMQHLAAEKKQRKHGKECQARCQDSST